MKTFLKNALIPSLIVLVLLSVGFLVGRLTTSSIADVQYLPGEPIHDSIDVPVPYMVKIPSDPVLPTKPDTVYLSDGSTHISLKVDTPKVFNEYIAENAYSLKVFDNDTLGSLTIDQIIQYNKIKKFSYNHIPIHKVVTVERKHVFAPFIVASYNSFNQFGVGGGIYYHNLGVSATYITDFVKKGYGLGIHYKF